MPLAYQTPHKPFTGGADAGTMAETPRGHPGAASEMKRGASAGVDAQGERARKLFAKLDVERREQFTLRHLALGHEEAVFAGIGTMLDGQVGGLVGGSGLWPVTAISHQPSAISHQPSQAISTRRSTALY